MHACALFVCSSEGVFVEHLKVEKAPRVHTSPKDNQAIRQYFPDNYKTFFDVISAIRSAGVIIGTILQCFHVLFSIYIFL